MARQYRLMSSDSNLEVPPERWVHRVPEKYRDRAPRTVTLPDGGDALLIEGQPLLRDSPSGNPTSWTFVLAGPVGIGNLSACGSKMLPGWDPQSNE
jgi:hypothetical protein